MAVYGAFVSSTLAMMSQSHSLNTISSNLANINTGGYKANETRFSTVLSKTLGEQSDLGGVRVKDYQRIDKDREFDLDLNAVDPAFEKAIRAMGIIAQGVFATEGGLDQNKGRIQDSLFLLSSSVSPTVNATPPFGTELSSNLEQIQSDLAFDMVLLSETNDAHARFIGFLQSSIAKTEDADPLDTITRLLDDSRTLEASYEALARVRELSLVNFLR